MNEEIKKVLDSLGSMAEIASFYYKQCLEKGFERDEALELTKSLVSDILRGSSHGEF